MQPALDTATALIGSSAAPAGSATRIVAIDGLGGAGKSTLAAALAERLAAPLVHTDDFASWDEPLEWWPRLLHEVLEPLAAGRDARFRRYDWEARRLADELAVPAGGIVLVEGVSSSRTEFRPHLAAAIWVETPRDLRLRRGLERDGADAEPLWRGWMAEEDAWVARDDPRGHADLVVSGTADVPRWTR